MSLAKANVGNVETSESAGPVSSDSKPQGSGSLESGRELRAVPVAWESLEDAFENNAPEVHSYLHLDTGEVLRIVDGIADPQMHQRIMGDPNYVRIEPVSSREQYRWMERFIVTSEESPFRDKLTAAIDGKGAFRRFKDVLTNYPVDRERWYTFRSERLKSAMEAWLETHSMRAIPRQDWPVPEGEVLEAEPSGKRNKVLNAEFVRKRIHELVDLLPIRDLDAALAFTEFLKDRKHLPKLKVGEPSSSDIDLDDESK